MSNSIITDCHGVQHNILDPNFDIEVLREQELIPPDYELCGTCGFDHFYDIQSAQDIKSAHPNESDYAFDFSLHQP